MLLCHHRKRGLTPIVAVILLLMMTVAAAGASFYWLIKIQGELQGGTEQYQEQVFDRMASSIIWQGADYNRSSEILSIHLQNTGTTKIPIDNSNSIPTTSWILLDSSQSQICSSNWNGTVVECSKGCGTDLDQSEVRTIELRLNASDCRINSYANDSLFYANIYFSGKATTSGTFEK